MVHAYSGQAQCVSADAQAVAGGEAVMTGVVADVDVAELRRRLEATEERTRQNYKN